VAALVWGFLMDMEGEMRWGRKTDETIASNEVEDPDWYAGGAHVDTSRVDDADRKPDRDDDDDVEDVDRSSVVKRERRALGGIKVGSAFFGWLTATGMALLLTAVATAGGAAVALARGDDDTTIDTIGPAEAAALLVIVFIAYYCGGYVAGRMARFNGMKQGFAVWIWAMVIAIAVAIFAAVAGDKWDVLTNLDNFPRIPADEGDLTTVGAIAAVATAVVTLFGSLVGGLAGMRFHRKVDRAGWES
jgi:hypothetical protein